MRVDLFEIEYSVSPGGVDCWEAEVYPSIGKTVNYSGYKTAGECIDYLLSEYPGERLNVGIFSLANHHKLMEGLGD